MEPSPWLVRRSGMTTVRFVYYHISYALSDAMRVLAYVCAALLAVSVLVGCSSTEAAGCPVLEGSALTGQVVANGVTVEQGRFTWTCRDGVAYGLDDPMAN